MSRFLKDAWERKSTIFSQRLMIGWSMVTFTPSGEERMHVKVRWSPFRIARPASVETRSVKVCTHLRSSWIITGTGRGNVRVNGSAPPAAANEIDFAVAE